MKLLLILGLILSQVPAVRQSDRLWHPATFRGMTVGKSKRADMVRVLGKPKWAQTTAGEGDEADKGGVTWNNYERVGEFPGVTNVAYDIRTGVITRIEFFPDKLAKEEAIAYFGRDYIVTRYAFDPCVGDEDSEPLYESPDGPLLSVEYRARGIAISVGYKDLVTKISYVDGPIGTTKARCK